MRRFLAVFIGFALVGCVAESTPIVSPDIDEENIPSSEQASTEGTASRGEFAVDVARIGSTQQGLSGGKDPNATNKPPPLPYRADDPPPPTPNPGDGR